MSINNNIKFLENIKKGCKRTVSWNKYRSETTTQSKNDNLDYMIDPTFRSINRLFVLSFIIGNNDPIKSSFDEYYMQLVKIKDFNILIDKNLFFDQPVKNKQEAYEKHVEMSRNGDYTTWNVLNYLYHQIYYKFIGIDLSRQTNISIPQKINFVEKLEEEDGSVIFLSLKSSKKLF